MANPKKDTLSEVWLRKLKNNPFVAALIIFAISIAGISAFTESANKMFSIIFSLQKQNKEQFEKVLKRANIVVEDIRVSYFKKDAILDILVLNQGDGAGTISRFILKVVKAEEKTYLGALTVSENYELDISELKHPGQELAVPVSHHLSPGEADRFQIQISSNLDSGQSRRWIFDTAINTTNGLISGPQISIKLGPNSNEEGHWSRFPTEEELQKMRKIEELWAKCRSSTEEESRNCREELRKRIDSFYKQMEQNVR